MATPNQTIDFGTFILSLAGSAMMHLGQVPDPHGATVETNLEMARQTIDILTMLRDKTHGNLDGHEAVLLEKVLHDTRVAYVNQAQKASV